MNIDPKIYGELCPECRKVIDGAKGEKDEPEVEAEKGDKPLDVAKKKADKRMNGLAIIITPAEQVSRAEAAEAVNGKDAKEGSDN
ncbi:MAG TPA: hypothetical protein PLL10_00180 [Elusimicrobiales bacterium]|nr:hypothetical protein [Elusimicrobiales bacterium]